MIDDQINKTIARHLGWTHISNDPDMVQYTARRPDGKWELIPRYTSDLNAMHEAEKTLDYAKSIVYGRKLWYIVSNEEYSSINDRDNAARLAHATAAQRAEAYLRVLNLWEE